MRALRSILDLLFPPRDSEALVNAATSEDFGALARPRAHDMNIVSLLPYRAPLVRACVREAKFRDSEKACWLLAKVLADYLSDEGVSPIFVPVPLSAERMKERGYNQAERILRKADVSVEAGLLIRTRDTLPQTSLPRNERPENVRDAFSLLREPDPAHTYIVFDDVLTTGSTLRSALTAFRASGAARVSGLALAH